MKRCTSKDGVHLPDSESFGEAVDEFVSDEEEDAVEEVGGAGTGVVGALGSYMTTRSSDRRVIYKYLV